jgi:prepilin-type N-terminal cleavage/methylation domain-containing protein
MMAATRSPKGFSLIEAMIAVVLVGLAVTALVVASNSFTQANSFGADLSTAEFLIEQIRELTVLLPVADPDVSTWTVLGPEEASLAAYDDVDDFDGATFSPPISANKAPLTDLSGFIQQVTVEKISASNFDTAVPDSDTSTAFVRITVNILKNGQQISSATWIRAKYLTES